MTTLPEFTKSTIIAELKYTLKLYNDFLNGSHQHDAYECFMTFIDIIHKGSKYYLVPGIEDEDNAVSLKIACSRLYLRKCLIAKSVATQHYTIACHACSIFYPLRIVLLNT